MCMLRSMIVGHHMQMRPPKVAPQDIIEAWDALSSECWSKPAAYIDYRSLSCRQIGNGAGVLSGCHAPELAIMQRDWDAVRCQLYVELNHCETIVDGELKGCEGVLRRL
jgi:hypothetical protein